MDWGSGHGKERRPHSRQTSLGDGLFKFQELISETPGVDFCNSGSCVLELREFHSLYSFSPKNNSGSCTEGTPGVALGGVMVILFCGGHEGFVSEGG